MLREDEPRNDDNTKYYVYDQIKVHFWLGGRLNHRLAKNEQTQSVEKNEYSSQQGYSKFPKADFSLAPIHQYSVGLTKVQVIIPQALV